MNFDNEISALAQRASSVIDNLQTEEATKNALIMPFIKALGYDVFNPTEVIPEFTADIGTKKGEKVDYAIMNGGEMIMLFECKKARDPLGNAANTQLYRYFSVTHSRIAVLTNGIIYQFYSDLEEPNKMDTKPFLEVDLFNLRDEHLIEIRKLSKEHFDLDQMLSTANELKYTSEIARILHEQLENPEEDFVKFFYTRTNPGGRFIASVKEQYTDFVQKAIRQYVNDRVNRRLRTALEQESTPADLDEQENEDSMSDSPQQDSSGIITTEEELEAYHIVKSIVRQAVSADRIVYRDTKSYMGILLDDNNRKTICRLWFNTAQKYLGVFDVDKNETRIPIYGLDDIYDHTEALKSTAIQYE